MSSNDPLAGLFGEQRAGAVIALDRITRPLELRDLDVIFGKANISRTHRRNFYHAMKAAGVVAIVRVP